MKFGITSVVINQLNIKEVESLECVMNMLRQIRERYGDDRVLMSPNTGEVVEIDEIPRMLGILDFFLQNRVAEEYLK